MGKATKTKKGKVPKITEEEYTAYLASLREMSGESAPTPRRPLPGVNMKSE